MPLTDVAVRTLGARIKEDPNTEGQPTATGLIKNSRGVLVIPSNKASPRGAKHGIPVDENGIPLPMVEKGAFGAQPPQPAPAPQPVETTVDPVKKGRKKKAAAAAAPAAPALTRVDITISGIGTVPSQYRAFWQGNDNVVLGLSDVSFIPAIGTTDGQNILELGTATGKLTGKYVYAGSMFADEHGNKYIILYKVG